MSDRIRQATERVLTDGCGRRDSILNEVKTVDEVLARFGPPDEVQESGSIRIWKETDKHSKISQQFRSLRYENLSETATVFVDVHPSGLVEYGIGAKPLGNAETEPSSD